MVGTWQRNCQKCPSFGSDKESDFCQGNQLTPQRLSNIILYVAPSIQSSKSGRNSKICRWGPWSGLLTWSQLKHSVDHVGQSKQPTAYAANKFWNLLRLLAGTCSKVKAYDSGGWDPTFSNLTLYHPNIHSLPTTRIKLVELLFSNILLCWIPLTFTQSNNNKAQKWALEIGFSKSKCCG